VELVGQLVPDLGKKFFFSQKLPDPLLGPNISRIPCLMEILSLGVNRPVSEADDPSLCGAEFENTCSYTSTPSVCILGTHRDNSTCNDSHTK
jgi:hypothetical protein